MGPDVVRGLPWNIVLLFGGGFALAHGFQVTGLARFIGGGFSGLGSVPPIVLILVICLSITFLTELTSNTATTEMVLPIFAAVAVSTGLHPLLLMIPATLSASCAFMMPVATPPNAVVFGSDRVKISEMARVGLVPQSCGGRRHHPDLPRPRAAPLRDRSRGAAGLGPRGRLSPPAEDKP